jgi:hypothetical protein
LKRFRVQRPRWVASAGGMSYDARTQRPRHNGRWRALVGHPLIGAILGGVLATVVGLYLAGIGPFSPGRSEHSRAVEVHDTVFNTFAVWTGGGTSSGCVTLSRGSLSPAPKTSTGRLTCKPAKQQNQGPTALGKRLLKLLAQANGFYDRGQWKQARLGYEAMFPILRKFCTPTNDLICQLLNRYEAGS